MIDYFGSIKTEIMGEKEPKWRRQCFSIFPGVLIQYLSHLATFSSRCIAIGIFASVFGLPWALIGLAIHMLIVSLLFVGWRTANFVTIEPTGKIAKFSLRVWATWMFCFTYFHLNYRKSNKNFFREFFIFNIIILIENIVVICTNNSRCSQLFSVYVMLAFLLGISLMGWYRYGLHPSKYPEKRLTINILPFIPQFLKQRDDFEAEVTMASNSPGNTSCYKKRDGNFRIYKLFSCSFMRYILLDSPHLPTIEEGVETEQPNSSSILTVEADVSRIEPGIDFFSFFSFSFPYSIIVYL